MTLFTIKDKGLPKKLALKLAAAAFWLLIWQAAYVLTAREILLISPARAFLRLLELSGSAGFWVDVASSCGRIISGFALAVLVGSLLAVATAFSKILYVLFKPMLEVIRATPVASFIILALVWLSAKNIPAFISFLMVVPMIWANVYAGITNTDPQLLEMAEVFRFSPLKKLECVYIPAVTPYFVSACSTGLGFAWKSGIAAEVIALPRHAVGKQIYNAKIYLETADLFAWTITVVILSVVIEKAAIAALEALKRYILKTPPTFSSEKKK